MAESREIPSLLSAVVRTSPLALRAVSHSVYPDSSDDTMSTVSSVPDPVLLSPLPYTVGPSPI